MLEIERTTTLTKILPREYDFDDVFIMPRPSVLSSRSEVNLEREFIFNGAYKYYKFVEGLNIESENEYITTWKGVPIISANMDTTGTFEVYNVLKDFKILTALNKHYRLNDYINVKNEGLLLDPDYFMVSTGITNENLENLKDILNEIDCKWICIDVANGYMNSFVEFCRKVRKLYPNKIIVAGNVVSGNMIKELVVNAGVDIVKIGIGPGKACLTRRQTGIGRPQLSAIMDCYNMCNELRLEGYNCYIISDGGIRYPGDMSKAFGAGADFVMIGSIFAGHDENPGSILEENGKLYKLFYGMSSQLAMEKYHGRMEDYRTSEGAVIKIDYKGSLANTVRDFLGGLRSTCTYVSARNICELYMKTTFVLLS
jgi:GMP reductase